MRELLNELQQTSATEAQILSASCKNNSAKIKQNTIITEKFEANCEHCSNSMKIGNLTVNIRSRFYPRKSLYDILFLIASTQIKEKSA